MSMSTNICREQTLKANVVILPGLSPIREAAFASPVFQTREMYAWRAETTGVESVEQEEATAQAVAPEIVRQIGALPRDIARMVRAMVTDDVTCITLPVNDDETAYLGYESDTQGGPLSICIQNASSEELIDVTSSINPAGLPLDLSVLYLRLCRLVGASNALDPRGRIKSHTPAGSVATGSTSKPKSARFRSGKPSAMKAYTSTHHKQRKRSVRKKITHRKKGR